MKLDRNINRGGRGKYALVNMRKLIPLLDKWDTDDTSLSEDEHAIVNAFHDLHREGIITLGNETPGDQFFVMKYKDKFTAAALKAYAWGVAADVNLAEAVNDSAKASDLREYAEQMYAEAEAARIGNRIPD